MPTADHDTRAALVAAAAAELAETGRADISLRAVARRAGVSHAAPGYVFGDRIGLLTAVAAAGFDELTGRLAGTTGTDAAGQVGPYGEAYVDFALEKAALFDLMFASPDLRHDDEDLLRARSAALGALDDAVGPAGGDRDGDGHVVQDATLVRWALAHGIAVLLRSGALQSAAAPAPSPSDLGHRLIRAFTATP